MAGKKKSANDSNKLIMMVIVGVLIGWIVGFAIGNNIKEDEVSTDQIEYSENKKESASTHSETLEVPAENAPTVKIAAHKDPKSGYNVNIATTNFTFAPQNASTSHVDGEGHAHIYVNGNKLGRVYGGWYHVDEVEDGENEIKVTLNSNAHVDYAVDGDVISDTIIVVEDGHKDHTHSEDLEDHLH